MKKLNTTFVIILLSINVFAQTPNWKWAKSGGGTSSDIGYGIASDASGSIYVTGYFKSASLTFGTTILTNAGSNDIFIAKYDNIGNILWAKSAGGIYSDISYGISTDKSGNIFITGSFSSPTIKFGTTTLTRVGASDIFIVKYDTFGNVLWAKSAGGTSNDVSNSVTTDKKGHVFITGYFTSPTITFGTTTLTNSDTYNVFIVKYDSLGNCFWAKSATGPPLGIANSVATDTNGNVFVTGYFTGAYITFETTALINPGIFIVKYNTFGKVLWAKSAVGTANDVSYGVSTDARGNAFITGSFAGTSITFGTTTLTNAGSSYAIFIVKYDSLGNVVWAKSAGGNSGGVGCGVSTDTNGNVFMTGSFGSPTITFGATTLTNMGSDDIFIAKYDSLGNVLGAQSAGGNSSDGGLNVSTDPKGNVFMAGYFNSPSITFGTTTLTNAGSEDIFIAKMDSSQMMVGIKSISEQQDNKVAIYPNPFESSTTIAFPEEQKNVTIKITDVLAKEIKTINFTGRQLVIDRREMVSGIYFFHIKAENGKVIDKKVVIH